MQSQKSLKFIKYFISLFLIAIFLLVLSIFGLLGPVEGFFGKITAPVVSFFSGASSRLGEIGSSIKDLGNLQKENKDLKNKVEELTLEVSRLKEAEAENESLKKQLNFVKSTTFKTVTAEVLTREPSSFLKVIILNRGFNSGIKKDMPAVSDGFLVGKVLEVSSDTSKVMLLADSNFQISGMIQENRALGVVKGQIGSGLVMEMIPKDKNVKVGDMVVTSNLEPVVPERLLIGKVTAVDQESGGLFQKASIMPAANLDEISNVVIILG